MSKTMPDERVQFEAGVFDTVSQARQAVYGLMEAGFDAANISVICSDHTKASHFREFEHPAPAVLSPAAATLTGGTIGAALGGFTGLAAAPAVGALTFWVAGPIAGLVSAGAVVGGLVGAMLSRGVEREIADYYQQAVVRGRILVAVEQDPANSQGPSLAQAARVLAEAGALPLSLPEG